MNRGNATEAAAIVARMMENLLGTVSPKGRAGSDARTAINDVRMRAFTLLMTETLGPPLAIAFGSARLAGCTLTAIIGVRQQIELETPRLPGAILVRNVGLNLCLAVEGKIIAEMTFVSRQDVETLKANISPSFARAEELAADSMDSQTYQALIRLHAAINNHLIRTALPLPRVVDYRFFEPLPTLILAYRLYSDASRADDIRKANKIVHPAFCPPTGKALAV